MFYAAIRRDSIPLLRFPFHSHVQVFLRKMVHISRLKRPPSCFSSPFCFPVIVVLLVLLLSVLFLMVVIGLSPRFFFVVFKSLYYYYYNYYFTLLSVFHTSVSWYFLIEGWLKASHQCIYHLFVWSLTGFSRTLLSILVVIWIVSTCPLIFKLFSPFYKTFWAHKLQLVSYHLQVLYFF